jgi:hypothetical protein
MCEIDNCLAKGIFEAVRCAAGHKAPIQFELYRWQIKQAGERCMRRPKIVNGYANVVELQLCGHLGDPIGISNRLVLGDLED